MIKDISDSHLQLFAKLSKILAETFEDIHKICLRQSGSEQKNVSIRNNQKQQWLARKEESKLREQQNELGEHKLNIEQDQSKPPKPKKTKLRPADNHNQNNGGKKQQKKKKIAKWQQQGKPRPPLNAFMLFLRDSKFQIMQAKPELTPSEVSAYASALWNELTQDQKQKYRGEYRQNRVRYDEELKQFHQKQKLLGRLPTKMKKGAQKSEKVEKDILDKDLMNVESDVSDSLSGI